MKNQEVAKKVVDRIVTMIESGKPLPWVKPWNTSRNTVTIVDGVKTITIQPNAWNRQGKQYRGVNRYLPQGEYITFSQAKAEGGSVKKGALGYPVVYWNFYRKTETDETTGEETEVVIPILKYYTVFRVEDVDGIEQKHHPEPITVEIPITHTEVVSIDGERDLNADAEQIVADYIKRAGNGFHVERDRVTDRAFYSPSGDYVSVPMREQYSNVGEYYSTLFHELGHSTGHASRLNRFAGSAACAAFGSQDYSREELVAESTAASILNALGMEDANTFRNSAAYIKSWSEAIKGDPMMFITAATRSQAAFDLIMGIEDTDSEPEVEESGAAE